jgi:hypothetical protein
MAQPPAHAVVSDHRLKTAHKYVDARPPSRRHTARPNATVAATDRLSARRGQRGLASAPNSTEIRGRVPAELVVKFKAATAQ